jgi:uncharacterized repeat protein (TIGR03803 family)
MRPKELCSGPQKLLFAALLTLVSTTSVWAAKEKVLHSFVAFPHGANPQANLIADAAGNLYGTSANGGRYRYGTVFELAPGKNGKWNQTVLYSFTGGSDGGIPVAGLVFDNAGSLYGTTATGGVLGQHCFFSYNENGCGVVFKLSPSAHGAWAESVLYAFNGFPNDGRAPRASLLFDTAGNLYGTTVGGGAFEYGTVFELISGNNGVWTEMILYDFSGGADGADPGANLISDSAGNLYGTTEYGGDLGCVGSSGCGTVFKLTPDGKGAWSETTLHSFTYADGAGPLSGLVFDPAGNLYGTTYAGPGFACNNGGCGIVFRLRPNSDGTWTETVLYNFEGGSDGIQPAGGVVLDGAGNLYGTTQGGGGLGSCYLGCGTVFELSAGSQGHWTEKVIHRFGLPARGQNDGIQLMSSLLLDQAGNLYGTATNGGDESCNNFLGCGTVFKLSPASGGKWTTSLLYAFSASPLGVGPGGLLFDGVGNLFGVTQGGGSANYGAAIELMPQASGGWKAVVLHTFTGGRDGAQPGSSLIADEAGNLYGTTINGGTQGCSGYASCGGVVFELSPTAQGWKETVLHRFGKNNNRGYLGPAAGLVSDSSGNLYGTTPEAGSNNCGSYGCGTVYKLSPVGGGKWREDLLYLFQGGSDGAEPLNSLVFDHAGNLYGTTCGGGANSNGTVFELAPQSDGKWKESVLYSFQGSRNGDGDCPYAGVIFDPDGNLYGTTFYGGNYTGNCANYGCGVVFKLSPTGGSWKETVLLAFQGTDGSNPASGLTLDAAGNLYGSAPFDGSLYFDSGVVFELSPGSKGWTEHVLHRFGNGLDGSGPNSTPILDSAGNIYGTTDIGGTGGGGTFFELSLGSGEEWVNDLATPPPDPHGFTPPYIKPDAKREPRLVRNIPQAR